MATPNHYSCAVIYREVRPSGLSADMCIEFRVIDYQSIHPRTRELSDVQIKFPGGGVKYPHESPGETMAREVFEETWLCVYDWKKEWRIEISPTHTQHGFLISADDCRGYPRLDPMLDDDGDLLSPPYWVKAATLGRVIFPSHREHYLAACRELGIEPIPDPNHSP